MYSCVNIIRYMKYIFFVSFLFFCAMGAYGAHANGFGVTLDQKVGDYIANIDYDAVTGIYAGSPAQFAFQLFNKDRSQQIEFSDVWVSITPTGKNKFARPVFDGGIVGSTFPPSSIAFAFPISGSYTLTLRYEKADQTLAEATFPLDVLPGEGNTGQGGFFHLTNDVFKGGLAVVALWIIVGLGRRMLRKKETA